MVSFPFSRSPAVATPRGGTQDTDRTPLLWDPESQLNRVNRDPHSQPGQNQYNTLPYINQYVYPLPPPPHVPQALKHKDHSGNDPHTQFCLLTGCPPSNFPPDKKFRVPKKSLYGRTIAQLSAQRRAYNASAALNNILLLSQVILGAALTALGASASSHVLITLFGATNTIIAGVVAYLKSRGQPMRARVYRDDLERIVDEIENSEVMWRGISEGVHGYDDIDTDEVTVRSEVARLTRLYDRAIRLNEVNNPDMYMAGAGTFDGNSGGPHRANRSGVGAISNVPLPAVAPPAPQPSGENPNPAVSVSPPAEDASPATKVVTGGKDKDKKESKDQSTDAPKNGEDKKPVSNDANNDTGKAVTDPSSSKTVDPASASGSNSSSATPVPVSVPAPAPTPAPIPFATSAPAPVSTPIDDPDASPATAAHLKLKKSKDKQQQVISMEPVQQDGDNK